MYKHTKYNLVVVVQKYDTCQNKYIHVQLSISANGISNSGSVQW